MITTADLQHSLGGIDIYLLDQVLRRRIADGARVIDAGCGTGRNLQFFLQAGYDVRGCDADPGAVHATRELAGRLVPGFDPARVREGRIEDAPFPAGSADLVVASAVLHFARDDEEFSAMVQGCWRLVAPGGLLFARLASSIGIEADVRPLAAGGRRFRLPDGSDRYLVDAALLHELTGTLGGRLLDPIKTTVVDGLRAMTTWVVGR